jgi:hypothetical protein
MSSHVSGAKISLSHLRGKKFSSRYVVESLSRTHLPAIWRCLGSLSDLDFTPCRFSTHNCRVFLETPYQKLERATCLFILLLQRHPPPARSQFYRSQHLFYARSTTTQNSCPRSYCWDDEGIVKLMDCFLHPLSARVE